MVWCLAVLAGLAGAGPAWAQAAPGPPLKRHEASTRVANRPPDDGSQLQLEITEKFLNRLVARHEVRQSNVRDFVLGAEVYGRETTLTDVAIKLRPSARAAAADVVLSGRNYPDTLGYTPQAVVHTLGFHSFTARKLVVYDGELFHTQRPRVSVVPCNQTVGVWTPFSSIPLIGPAVTSFAFQAALQRRGESEAITAEKIRERVGPEFNRSLDEELADLNRGWLTTLRPRLSAMHWLADEATASSTHEAIRLELRYDDAPFPASNSPWGDAAGSRIVLHEGLLNRAFHRLMLGGTVINPDDADRYWQRINDILNTWAIVPEAADDDATAPTSAAEFPMEGVTIRLGDHEPVRVEFLSDQAILHAAVAISVPPLVQTPLLDVAISYRIERDDRSITFAPHRVQILPVEPNQPGLGAMAPLIEQQALAHVRRLRIPRRFKLPPPDLARVEINISDIAAEDGWLLLSFE